MPAEVSCCLLRHLFFGCYSVHGSGNLSVGLGEVFDYLVAHGRMKEKEARAKFRQVCAIPLSKFAPLCYRATASLRLHAWLRKTLLFLLQ